MFSHTPYTPPAGQGGARDETTLPDTPNNMSCFLYLIEIPRYLDGKNMQLGFRNLHVFSVFAGAAGERHGTAEGEGETVWVFYADRG
jgi:hypothetical protein